ncbi:serine kinase [Candidatus Neomarinimicrobiota bacterium]
MPPTKSLDSEKDNSKATSAPLDFFNRALETFNLADNTSIESSKLYYAIADYKIQFNFANKAVIPFQIPAFSHLQTDKFDDPDLTIHFFDSASTGVQMPPPPWTGYDYLTRGEIRGFNTDQINTSFHRGSGVLSVLNKISNQAVWWIKDVQDLPSWESGSPLLFLLFWWMSINDRQFLHAGAVGNTTKGILLAGAGGSGKSTTALTCLNSDLKYVSDDYCLINSQGRQFIHSIYSSAKIHKKDFNKLPHITKTLENSARHPDEKPLFFLNPTFKNIVRGFPLKYIFVPHITNQPDTSIVQTSPMHALKALAPSTIFQLSRAGKPSFDKISKIVKQIPCYQLNLGNELSQISEVISEFLVKVE